MPAKKRSADKQADQSKRFVDAAKKAEADESGKSFERALRTLIPARRSRKKGHAR